MNKHEQNKHTGAKISAVIVTVIIILILFSACTTEEYFNYIEDNFGFTVKTKIVTLSNGTKAYEWISGEFTNSQKQQIHDSLSSSYNITKSRDATVKYNCHSYAWHSTSSSNKYWIDDPTKYRSGWLKSTSWTNTIPSGIKNGDKVDYYVKSDHRPHSAEFIV